MKLRLTTCIIVPSSCGSQSCVMPTTRLREDLRVSWDLSLPTTLTCVGTGGHSWIGLMHTSTPGCTSIRHPSCLREVDSEKFNPAMITSRAWISVERSVEDDNLCWPEQKCGIVSYVQEIYLVVLSSGLCRVVKVVAILSASHTDRCHHDCFISCPLDFATHSIRDERLG